MERRHITLPLTEELAKTLHAGESGTAYRNHLYIQGCRTQKNVRSTGKGRKASL